MFYGSVDSPHGAERWVSQCNCGAGKWLIYRSKCGACGKIEHEYDQLDGGAYGPRVYYYKHN